MAERVVVGMSGGVDSSVTAARLVDQGFDVVGVTLHLWDEPDPTRHSRCCAPEDIRDAKRVADHLGIPHYTLDRKRAFASSIVEPFVEGYLQGVTPSPCAHCNATIKFPALLRLAHLVGAPWVATGHYARVVRSAGGELRIARGIDHAKDQSYFLHALGPGTLSRLRLPLGESRKPDVRDEALRRGLAGAGKGESQDLCIVPDGDYAAFVEAHAQGRLRKGDIVDGQGRVLGQHGGVHKFTIGQRKGLGIAAGRPLFVARIDASRAEVVVDDDDALMAAGVIVPAPRLASGATLPARAVVRVRYRHEGTPARLEAEGTALRVTFDQPVRAASRGQVAVAYDGDLVIGGGVIGEVIPWRGCGLGAADGTMGSC